VFSFFLLCYSASVPLPTADQLRWSTTEMACFFHFNIATAAGTQGCNCNQPVPDLSIWKPSALDTDVWIQSGINMGCKRFVYVAKHGCGFITWHSAVKNYPYTVLNSPNGTDIVASFVASAKKYGVGYGFYYTTVLNTYAGVCNSVVQPGSKYTQAEYDAMVLQHLSELWGNFGPLAEVWFDGGYNQNMAAALRNLFATLQPHVVAFQADKLMPSPVRWVGTESGYAPYPCWSTSDYGTYGAGSPDSNTWFPAETDFTLQNSDQWFYNQMAGVHSASDLRNMYETSVGHNTALIINFSPFANGSISRVQITAAETLGTYIRSCYNNPIIQTSDKGNLVITLNPSQPITFDRIVLQEDQTFGQLVRKFSLAVKFSNGTTRNIVEGSSIGNKFIEVLKAELQQVASVTLNITSINTNQSGGPFIKNFAVFSCGRLAEKADNDWKSYIGNL